GVVPGTPGYFGFWILDFGLGPAKASDLPEPVALSAIQNPNAQRAPEIQNRSRPPPRPPGCSRRETLLAARRTAAAPGRAARSWFPLRPAGSGAAPALPAAGSPEN